MVYTYFIVACNPLKHHVKLVIIHFVAFLDFNDITKGLTSHQGNICSYFHIQVGIRERLDEYFAPIGILTTLNCIIGVKIVE